METGSKRRKKKRRSDHHDVDRGLHTSISRGKTEADFLFNPEKLSILINGESKPFSEWTNEYARQYYPGLGRRTYRVPPVDFNTQELTHVAGLGFSELRPQKNENRKKDRSQADVGSALEDLGQRLEIQPDGGGGLFIVANVLYDSYLNKLKEFKTKGKKPPLPQEVASRGELDFLVLHPQKGILLIQVKGVGSKLQEWKASDSEHQKAIRKKVTDALKQLKRDEEVLHHIMKDLQLGCPLHRVVALPFVSRETLQTSLKMEEGVSCCSFDGTTFLTSDDMASSDSLLDWWNHLVTDDETCDELTDFQLQCMVGRYCGLLSTVEVWSNTDLRVEVRDVAEAASEVGSRFASIVLTPDQQAALDCQEQYVYLHGPPGSGKSVMLVVKARQWMMGGNDIGILNLDFGKAGLPVGHYIHESINRWVQQTFLDPDTPAFETGTKEREPDYHDTDVERGNAEDDKTLSKENGSSQVQIQSRKHPEGTQPKKPVSTEGLATVDQDAISNSSGPDNTENSSAAGPFLPRCFRIDMDLEKNTIEDLMKVVRQNVRPGVPCYFLKDEFYWRDGLMPVVEAIKAEFPKSKIWCAEITGPEPLNGFAELQLKAVLRCPPTVQGILKKTDWVEQNRELYTEDSTLHGLPTDGLKPRLLQHEGHLATSPLECPQCADLLLDFFRQDLKLEFGQKCNEEAPRSRNDGCLGSSKTDENARKTATAFNVGGSSDDEVSLRSTASCRYSGSEARPPLGKECTCGRCVPSDTSSQKNLTKTGTSLPPGKESGTSSKAASEKRSTSCTRKSKSKKKCSSYPAQRVKFSDIVLLVSYPQLCYKPDPVLLLVRPRLMDDHHTSIQESAFYQRLLEAGLPTTFLAPTANAQDIALPSEDKVLFTVTNAVIGLERKIVVYIPCESKHFNYPVSVTPPLMSKSDDLSCMSEATKNTSAPEQNNQLPHSAHVGDSLGCKPQLLKGNVTKVQGRQPPYVSVRSGQLSDCSTQAMAVGCKAFGKTASVSFSEQPGKAAETASSDISEGVHEFRILDPPSEKLQPQHKTEDASPLPHDSYTSHKHYQDTGQTCRKCQGGSESHLKYSVTSGQRCRHVGIESPGIPQVCSAPFQDVPSQDVPSGSAFKPDEDDASHLTQASSGDTAAVNEIPAPQGFHFKSKYNAQVLDYAAPVLADSRETKRQAGKAGLSDDDWAKLDSRLLTRNMKSVFYSASRCLAVFVLIIP